MEPVLGRKKRSRKVEDSEEEPNQTGARALPALPADPTLSKLVFIDWRKIEVLQNAEAVGVIKNLVKECHPAVLDLLLDAITDRIMADYSLWSLKRRVRDMRDLGDVMYR